jgi:hypothetical protein
MFGMSKKPDSSIKTNKDQMVLAEFRLLYAVWRENAKNKLKRR